METMEEESAMKGGGIKRRKSDLGEDLKERKGGGQEGESPLFLLLSYLFLQLSGFSYFSLSPPVRTLLCQGLLSSFQEQRRDRV